MLATRLLCISKVIWYLALPDDICDLFADSIQRTYANDVWVPSDPRPDLVQDDSEELCIRFCASNFSFLLQIIIDMCFPDRWKGRHKNVEDYRGVAILSAIPKRFELLLINMAL
jgi:hypothetical protein